MVKTILVVDDEPELLEAVKARLEAHSYEVVTASDGQEGISKAKQLKPDLILMDIMMPNLSGGDAIKAIKKDSSISSTPFIFLTAVFSKEEEERGQRIQVGDEWFEAIAKPFDSDELIRKVGQIIG